MNFVKKRSKVSFQIWTNGFTNVHLHFKSALKSI